MKSEGVSMLAKQQGGGWSSKLAPLLTGRSWWRGLGAKLGVVVCLFVFVHCSTGSKVGELCRLDSDCGSGFFCDQGRCAGVTPQQESAPNDAGNKDESSACPTSCKQDSDCAACPGGFIACRETARGGVCGTPSSSGCQSDSECKNGQRCEQSTCVGIPEQPIEKAGCQSNSDCEQGARCVSGTCTTSGSGDCSANSDCQPGQSCLNAACKSPSTNCQVNDDCRRSQRCVKSRCQSVNAACQSKSDCGSKQSCNNGACKSSGQNGNNNTNTNNNNNSTKCTSNEDCSTNLYCDTATGICKPSILNKDCTTDTDCTTPGACTDKGHGCICDDTPEGKRCITKCLSDSDCPLIGSRQFTCDTTTNVCKPPQKN